MLKTSLAVLALTFAPGLATAQCYGDKSKEAAASCAAGATWDEAKGACVVNPTT